MKAFRLAAAASLTLIGPASASLYDLMSDGAEESSPLKWTVGVDLIWDDNVNPTIRNIPPGNPAFQEDAISINPYVGVSFVNMAPQTSLELFGRIGAIYYFEEPSALGSDDIYPDLKLGLNLTHRFSERLRWVSRNYVAYQLEPDYAYGFASSRVADAYLYWSTDQALGFRWSERFATYTGINFTGLDYGDAVFNQDRTTWEAYNDFRFQLSPQTVLTMTYRYGQTTGGGQASDSVNHYILGGFEHRVSPTTILSFKGGVQMREVDTLGGADETSPYAEAMLRSQINEQFTVRCFARYGIEDWDTVFGFGEIAPLFVPIEFDSAATLRVGVSADYAISPMLNIFGGVSYVGHEYEDGRLLSTPIPIAAASASEDLINAYVGLSVKLNDWLYAQASYNFTNSSSDILSRDYDRNRISLGMRAEF